MKDPKKHLKRAARRPGGSRVRREAGSNEAFARFFAQSLDLQCIAGFDGFFKLLNPAWESQLGWALNDLESRPFIDFVHPDDRGPTGNEVARLAGGAEVVLFENRYRHRNGSYRWLQWTAHSEPSRRCIYATARDITRQKRLEQKSLAAADRERERLGRELHDGICQNLSGIAALSSALSRRLARSSESTAASAAAEITEHLHGVINQARDLARGLGPPALRGDDLAAALASLAMDVRNLHGVSCRFVADRSMPALRGEVEAHLFRIAQEAVNNAIVHGRPDRITIHLARRDDGGLLSVRDDGEAGRGQAPCGAGIGLHTMSYRASLMGASLDVRRPRGKGTSVRCVFPLPDKPGRRGGAGHVRRRA